MSTHIITDLDRIAMYGHCVVCRAPRDVLTVTDNEGNVTMDFVCTASVRADLNDFDWGHKQS